MDCAPRKSIAFGATLAEQHLAKAVRAFTEGAVAPGSLIMLDFTGIKAVNGSYIKGTALWMLTCGKLFASNSDLPATPRHITDARPLDIYPCVTGLTAEVEAEFQEFFKPRGLPLLFARRVSRVGVEDAVLLGHLDPALKFTLNALTKLQKATAPQLHERFPDERITVTAWNNRLNDLYALRLVRRIRAGRSWEYETLTKTLKWE